MIDVDFKTAYTEPRKKYVDNGKVKEHYAIIPTKKIPERDQIEGDKWKLYYEIVIRTLMMFAP